MSKLKISLASVFVFILMGIFSAVAFAADGNPPTSTNPAPGIHVGDVDNFGNKSTHRTHGNFQNNTNSCANCHSTHNGENAQLTMKSDELELCMSCHDGTMGFYNVKEPSGAGTFDDSHMSTSMHRVSAGIQIGAAPDAVVNKVTTELECSSCHNPHGSPNDRLLKETVLGTTAFAYTTVNSVKTAVPTGNKTITLDLTEDPAYQAINDLTGTGGLKITKSAGPKGGTTGYAGVNDKIYYSQFCSACHDDLFASRSTGRPSNSTKAPGNSNHDFLYTHGTNSSSTGRNCGGCHYAHGTNVLTMMDTQGKKVADYVAQGWTEEKAEEYMKDVTVNGSSNKKFTNYAVCWTCHQSTHKIDTNPVDPQFLNGAGQFPGKVLIK
jgi:predicted CXXCH cytochrome family protein